MLPVYQEHFGLIREPFNVTPDPSFLYLSTSHREALAQLIYGIKARKGFIVLTGEVGTGKTTLIRALLRELNGNNTQTSLIYNTIVTPKDLLRHVCDDYGIINYKQSRKSSLDYLEFLNEFLLESYKKSSNCALIIDEAQNLSCKALETIRLLSNFETAEDKLLQILLVGQPELATRLSSPELRQLKQRVTLRHHLRALNFAECSAYIAKRMEVAGGSSSVFTPRALETIYTYSGGVPRLVNILCDNGLLTAYALGQKSVKAPMIREVAEDLNITVPEKAAPLPVVKPLIGPLLRESVVRRSVARESAVRKSVASSSKATSQRWSNWVLLLVACSVLLSGVFYFWDQLLGDFSFLNLGLVSEMIEEFAKELKFVL